MVNLKSSLLSASLSISAVMTTLISTLVSTTASATEVNQATIDAVKEKIVASCPVRWEDHSKSLVLPTLASDDIWENADDRSAFVTYITDVLTELGSSNSADDLANDVNTVAAECATHRTALLDLLLVKEPNDLVLSMRAMKRNLDELAAAGSDGASRETAAKDCKAIKTAFPESEDGAYWIDVNGGSSNDAIEVFCDMTTDGGGWTFVAYASGSETNIAENGFHSFFNEAHGQYDVNRLVAAEHFSIGVLPEINDTEMMVTIGSPDPLSAYENKRFVRFRYKPTAPMFNFGPIPGTDSFMEQSYQINSPVFKPGSIRAVSASSPYTYWGANSEYYSLMFYGGSSRKGIAIGSAVWYRGNEPRNAVDGSLNAWFYVR
ncbi:MAG: fibrinogen-like YCDxxxxGGGW domain-containing protein [Arenicella sp.]